MAIIVTRAGKGLPLSNTELDANFVNLNTDKLEQVAITNERTAVATLTNKTLTGAVLNGTLGATTPSSVAATTISATGAVTGLNLSGTNTGDQINIPGNAATATALQTARTIGGVSFNGTANISLPGVNAVGNQNTTGNAATVTNGVYTAGNQAIDGNKTFSGVTGIGAGWTVEQNGTGLLFSYLGTSRMRLDASGNLIVSGNITAFGTV